jgi:hypothetical protein
MSVGFLCKHRRGSEARHIDAPSKAIHANPAIVRQPDV